MAEPEEYESVLCVKPEVHVYRVPPRASNRGYRAAEWQLDQPAWSGRMRITARGNTAYIKLEDKNSGELFAQAPVEQFPSITVEGVTDSSRYFVIRIEDGNGMGVEGAGLSSELDLWTEGMLLTSTWHCKTTSSGSSSRVSWPNRPGIQTRAPNWI